MFAHNYYTHSKYMTQSLSTLAVAIGLSTLATACGAHAPPPRMVRYADLVQRPESGRHIFEQPIILAFERGDRLPIHLSFDDALFTLDPAQPALAFIAKERCYVRIDGSGIRTSPTPDGFDTTPRAPGSFFFGFSHRPTGPSVEARVRTPRR